jgi:hypothetical protein
MIVYYTYISLYQGNIGKIENHKIFRKRFSSANNIYYEHVLEEDSSNSQTLYCPMSGQTSRFYFNVLKILAYLISGENCHRGAALGALLGASAPWKGTEI